MQGQKNNKDVDRYLDAPATRRQVLNAIEQLLAAHEERHHMSGTRRLFTSLCNSARKMHLRIREARNA